VTITLGDARSEVRALLDSRTTSFWPDNQINSWLNQGCADIARRAEVLWQEAYFTVTPTVQTYSFPNDFLNAHRAEFTLSGAAGPAANQTFNLEYRGINQMDEVWGILHGLPAAYPQYFTIRGNNVQGFFMMLYPAPGATGLLTVYYYRTAVPATNDAMAMDTLPGWVDIVYDYAVYKALRAARDPAWQEAYQLYEKNLAEMVSKTRNMTDQAEQVTTGSAQWPIYAYAELPDWWA
jgi:hypothetical protein